MQRETGKRVAGGTSQKKPKKRKSSRLTWQQKLLLVIAILLAIALAVVVACQSQFVQPEFPTEKDPDTPEEEVLDYGDGIQPKGGGERKSDAYYTVLILGRDTGGGGQTDTMLLASYDVTNQKATVMSIPRDTMVNVSWDVKKINSVYNMYGGGEKGIQAVYKEVSQLVGFEPDFQVVVEWDAVGQIVDAMEGVWFDVPRNMNYDDDTQNLHIHQTAGYRLLSGDDAMQVIRYRYDNVVNGKRAGYIDGDLGRIKTQQAFLQAMVEQLLQVKNIPKISQFVKVFQDNVETDMNYKNILWFAQQAVMGGLKAEDVNFITMPNQNVECWSRQYKNMQSYVVPVAGELLELVNNELSPFVETFTMKDLDIMSVNSDGSVSSSTGYVEDSQAALPPVIPKPEEDPPEEEDPISEGNSGSAGPETGENNPPANLPGTTTPGTTAPVTPPDNSGTTQTETPVTPPAGGEEKPPEEPVTPTEPTDPSFSIIEPPPMA